MGRATFKTRYRGCDFGPCLPSTECRDERKINFCAHCTPNRSRARCILRHLTGVPGRLERLERIPHRELFWDDSAKEQLLWQTSEPSLHHGGVTFSSLCRSSPTSCFAANTHG